MGHGGDRYDVVVPDGLALDALTVRRLARRLDEAGPDVAAVVAHPEPVPAGSSARVLAERTLARPDLEPALRAVTGQTVRAAGLARPDRGVTVVDGELTTGGAGVYLDPGAVAADLDAALVTLVDADPAGRPIFTRRPVVVVAVDHENAGEAAALTDALLAEDVEARLAIDPTTLDPATALPTGPKRAPACALSEATLAALRPDVVVTFDQDLRHRVEPWCTERYTLQIEVVDELHDRAELVSWRHGEARGRVRGRIGPQVPAAELAALVARLCGGPPPVLPTGIDELLDRPQPSAVTVRSTVRRRATGPIRSVALVGAPDGALDRRRWAGVAEQFSLIGCTVTTDAIDTEPVNRADLVLCGGRLDAAANAALVGRRERGGRTVALIGHHDVLVAPDGAASLTGAAEALVETIGRALVPSAPLAALTPVGDLGQTRLLPTMVGWERIVALEQAGTSRPAGGEAVLGWLVDSGADPTPHLHEVRSWLSNDPSASLVVITASGSVPDLGDLAGHPQVTTVDTLDAIDAAGWTAVVWSPTPGRAAGAGEILPAVELALAGVPVLAADADRAALGGLGDLVTPPTARLLNLGATEARNRGRRSHDRAATLHGAQSAAVRAHRVLGWLLADGAP